MALLVFLAIASGSYWVARDVIYDSLRCELMALARTGAAYMDPQTVNMLIHTENGPEARAAALSQLDRLVVATPTIRYAYLLQPTGAETRFRFLADTDREEPAAFLEELDANEFPDLVAAVNGPAADHRVTRDKWGYWLSGYAPVRDGEGHTLALIGIDMPANRVYRMTMGAGAGALVFGGLGGVAAMVMARWIRRRLTWTVQDLTNQVRSISERLGELPAEDSAASREDTAELLRYYERMVDRLKESRAEQHSLFEQTLRALSAAVSTRDAYTGGHSEEVAALTDAIADRLGVTGQDRVHLRYSSLLHDIGKIGVPDRILLKAGPLTLEERREIEEHPRKGYELLNKVQALRPVAEIVLAHHERWDGTGYPRRLAGEAIPLSARIIAVVDAFSAITTDRTYRKARTVEWALEELQLHAGTQFDPAVVRALVEAVQARAVAV